jgi:hypothetical protein
MSSEINSALRREVIALKHNGPTMSENLAYACFACNPAKGTDIASIDPQTGLLTSLYNPRTQIWHQHFRFNGPVIEPLTAEGRVTVFLLKMNATTDRREDRLADARRRSSR